MTPEKAYRKALNSRKRLPGLEPIIAQDTWYTCCYAANVIQGRWPEAEETIQQDAFQACSYARDVIKGRWPEAEPIIQHDAEYAYWYAACVIQDRWPEAEEVIAQGNYKSEYISNFFSEPLVTKDQYSEFEWERVGAVGFFAPQKLFDRKESLIDMMIDNQDMLQC